MTQFALIWPAPGLESTSSLILVASARITDSNFWFITGGRYIVTSGHGDLFIRSVRPDDAMKRFSCLTTNSLTGERKLSESVALSIKGKQKAKTNIDKIQIAFRLLRRCDDKVIQRRVCFSSFPNDVELMTFDGEGGRLGEVSCFCAHS